RSDALIPASCACCRQHGVFADCFDPFGSGFLSADRSFDNRHIAWCCFADRYWVVNLCGNVQMTNLRIFSLRGLRIGVALIALAFCAGGEVLAQSNDQLTPLQRKIEKQKQRLSSGDVEERRDAL